MKSRTSPLPAERTPVIVGVGELVDREDREGRHPLQLMAAAAALADRDAGGGWLSRVERLDVVHQFTWTYADPAAAVAAALAITPRECNYTEVGGETPVRLLMQAAADIVAGRLRTALVCGAEAMQTLRLRGQQGGVPPGWPAPTATVKGLDGSDYVTPLAARFGLINPTEVYTLYEHATRAAQGESMALAQQHSGQLWAQYAAVAAAAPCAWNPAALSAEEILRPGPHNKPLSFPYSKNLVAQIFVNQGAAFIVTTLAEARAQRLQDAQCAYVWSGAGAAELEDFLQRQTYAHSAAMEAVLRSTLTQNGLSSADFDAVELYSCFPCVPKMALRVLGPLRDGVAPTVTGGLSFFGGPGNNFMSHAVVAMVRALRAGRRYGLLYGQGGYVSKHHAAVLSSQPPSREPVDARCEIGSKPVMLCEKHEGAAQLESYLLRFGRDGAALPATVLARTPDGARVLARLDADDRGGAALLQGIGGEPVGQPGLISQRAREAIWSFTAAVRSA